MPLPPIPGERFLEQDRVAVSIGWTWYPQVTAATVKQILDLDSDSTAVLLSDGSWLIIPGNEWVGARRAAVRATRRMFAPEKDRLGGDANAR